MRAARCPGPVVDDLVTELRDLVELVPGPATGPKGRALVDRRPARSPRRGARAAADSRRTTCAWRWRRPARASARSTGCADVWRGGQPLWATVLSPFWDDAVPAAGRRRGAAAPHRATRQSTGGLTLVAAVDPFTGTVQAPPSLASQAGPRSCAFDPPDAELRSLHAKLLLVESDEWLAALIGSSNATEAGYGLNADHGHHELNLWLGCPASSKTAKHLRSLARIGEPIDSTTTRWEPVAGRGRADGARASRSASCSCIIDAATPPRVLLDLDPERLPASWGVRTPAGHELLTADELARRRLRRSPCRRPARRGCCPAYLLVRWDG